MIERVGSYQVVRELGRGGMGVVYLAVDERLGRDVAIKALPEHLANEPDRLVRFQREARVLASLNHPNIAGIHGLEESEGNHYLVLEYVEGESLDTVLQRGPLPMDEAVETAIAIAHGLEAAHDKGIVHRDLKPANIMITADGIPKVLDFGLARQSETPDSTTDYAALAETLTSSGQGGHGPHSPTIAGVIMGTAGYMSPEQARGRQADKRSDIFSFGCVLYELLTGARPFPGETVADVLGATLHKELDLSLLPDSTPPNVRRVLTRCLIKEKRNRLHDIADARIELQTPEAFAGSDQPEPGRSVRTLLVFGSLLLCAGAAAAWLLKPGGMTEVITPPPQIVLDAEILLPNSQRLGHAFQPGASISDDGSMIVMPVNDEPDPEGTVSAVDRGGWSASTGLMLRRLDTPGFTPVAGAGPGSLQPVFSADAGSIAYVTNAGTIMKISTSGGRPVRLCEVSSLVVGLDWHSDGYIYFGLRDGGGIQRVSETGGQPEAVTTPDAGLGENAHAMPTVLPDGGLLFSVYVNNFDSASIAYAPASGAAHVRLVDDASQPRYARGHVVFAREGALYALPFDPLSPEVDRDPRPLPEEVVHSKYYGNFLTRSEAAQFDLSSTGTLIIAEGGVPQENDFIPMFVDMQGTETPIEIEARSYVFARTMGDGERLVFMNAYDPEMALWIHEPERGISRRLITPDDIWFATGPGPNDVTLTPKPDGAGKGTLGVLDVDTGLASLRPLPVPEDLNFWPAQWSPDRQHLVGVGNTSSTDDEGIAFNIWVYEVDGGWSRLTDSEGQIEGWPSISPDGRWIVYSATESERLEVFVRPFNRPGPTRRVSTDGGTEPRWSPDGSEIFYRQLLATGFRPGRGVLSVGLSFAADDPERMVLARPVERFETASDCVAVIPITSWDFASDGRALFIRLEDPEARHAFMSELFPDRLRVVQNWASRLGTDSSN